MKKILLLFLFFVLLSSLLAHEFWLNPDKFIYKRTESVNIRFVVGENYEGENWRGNNEKIESLKIYFAGLSDDFSKFMTDQPGDSMAYTMLDEGTNLIAFNSTNSFIELSPAQFNIYLKEDGLTNALEYRKQANENGCNGREFYQRCAKTIVQVGDVKDFTFNIKTDLKLDIIPSSNPYTLKNRDSLRTRILFKNSPLANVLVKVWHRQKNKTEKIELVSNSNGEIKFPVRTSGKWMISAVTMERLADNPIADWQSYWGSLTWGYE